MYQPAKTGHFTPPVIIAAAPDRNFSDLDLIRLADGRFLAVIREHVTRQSFACSVCKPHLVAPWAPCWLFIHPRAGRIKSRHNHSPDCGIR
jgi:hypothetical protein